jgi:uncharacterized membrane protein
MRTTLFILISALIFSCKQGGNPLQNKSPAPILAEDTLRIIKELKGIYSNDGTKKFRSCDQPGMIYMVNDQSNLLDSAVKKLLPKAYRGEGIFVNLTAGINPATDKSFAGILELKEILKTEQKGPNNTCIPYDFWCIGTEPFWQVQISEDEQLIDFYNPMEQTTRHFLYAEPQVKDGVVSYMSEEADNPKNKISIRIFNEKCSDGMSDKQYSYRAEVILDRRYTGCAVKFN